MPEVPMAMARLNRPGSVQIRGDSLRGFGGRFSGAFMAMSPRAPARSPGAAGKLLHILVEGLRR
ncbi:MAG: hypothetical protein ABTQ25_14925, partial [Nitrosomonas ureae]